MTTPSQPDLPVSSLNYIVLTTLVIFVATVVHLLGGVVGPLLLCRRPEVRVWGIMRTVLLNGAAFGWIVAQFLAVSFAGGNCGHAVGLIIALEAIMVVSMHSQQASVGAFVGDPARSSALPRSDLVPLTMIGGSVALAIFTLKGETWDASCDLTPTAGILQTSIYGAHFLLLVLYEWRLGCAIRAYRSRAWTFKLSIIALLPIITYIAVLVSTNTGGIELTPSPSPSIPGSGNTSTTINGTTIYTNTTSPPAVAPTGIYDTIDAPLLATLLSELLVLWYSCIGGPGAVLLIVLGCCARVQGPRGLREVAPIYHLPQAADHFVDEASRVAAGRAQIDMLLYMSDAHRCRLFLNWVGRTEPFLRELVLLFIRAGHREWAPAKLAATLLDTFVTPPNVADPTTTTAGKAIPYPLSDTRSSRPNPQTSPYRRAILCGLRSPQLRRMVWYVGPLPLAQLGAAADAKDSGTDADAKDPDQPPEYMPRYPFEYRAGADLAFNQHAERKLRSITKRVADLALSARTPALIGEFISGVRGWCIARLTLCFWGSFEREVLRLVQGSAGGSADVDRVGLLAVSTDDADASA